MFKKSVRWIGVLGLALALQWLEPTGVLALPPSIGPLPPALDLPPTDTLDHQLAYLKWLQSQIPGSFTQAANYDVNLIHLILENDRLVSQLVKMPGYIKGHRDGANLGLMFST